MIREAIILAAGQGTKFWPYSGLRNKGMTPISNTPLLTWTVRAMEEAGIDHIVIASIHHNDGLRHAFRKHPSVEILDLTQTKGTADTLIQSAQFLKHKDPFLVLFGDCLIQPEDLIPFIREGTLNDVLVSELREPASNWIACNLEDGKISGFGGHHRGTLMTHQMVGFITDHAFVNLCSKNPGHFTNLKVGVGSPEEQFLEVSMMDAISDKTVYQAKTAKQPVFDLDKPWHALEANAWLNTKRCGQLKAHELDEGSSIDPSAQIDGFVRLGKNSRIGRNVWIRGNVIIGENTILDQGAIIGADVAIGDHCTILNHAKIGSQSTVGNRCQLDQGFEILGGLVMDHVYLVHTGEVYGMIGENTDIGAGTICGTLRFDDGQSVHTIQGRRETPKNFANATYLGDNCRTGVVAILMPGVKVGNSSVVGSGVVLQEDLSDHTLVYVKQDQIRVPWELGKYGW